MSKKKANPYEPVRAINAEKPKAVKREKHNEVVKTKGDSVVKWIFVALILLAVASIIWSMYVVA